jgi:hypothetical protein
MIEPLLGHVEAVPLLDRLRRRPIERPHPFVGVEADGREQRKDD